MRPVDRLAVALGAVTALLAPGCSRKSPSGAPTAAESVLAPRLAPAPSPADATAPEPATIAIEGFDCFKLQSGPPADYSAPGISTWSGGGPGGATWNALELNCKAVIRTTCKDGDVATETRIGKALVDRKTAAISGPAVEWRATLAPKQWEKNFDEVPSPRKAVYRTALFRLTAFLTCRAPYELQPSIGPRREFAADRMFLAGFASGE